MFEMPMAASRPHFNPSVLLEQTDHLAYFHRHSGPSYCSERAFVQQEQQTYRRTVPFTSTEWKNSAESRPILLSSFHPSQQDTSTGKLTEPMFRQVFLRVYRLPSRA
jgi:hypothetical protein